MQRTTRKKKKQTKELNSMKRIVVKVGSNVLTHPEGKLDVTRISAIVDQIVSLRHLGYEIILVSSGAVAAGRGELNIDHELDNVAQRQLFSSMGQVKLMGLYYDLFREYRVHIGQILTMKENFIVEEQYQNQQACMEVMLEQDVVPIINENDTVCITELMFTDNDELSGLVALMMNADALILLTNVNGLYTGAPSHPDSKLIKTVTFGQNISTCIDDSKSELGRGGMESKCHTAMKMAEEGIRVFIANGQIDDILINLIKHPSDTLHTEFIPNPKGKV